MQLFLISIISGTSLALVLKIVQILFGVQSYLLLFNMDYIPLLHQWNDLAWTGYVFHYLFCFVSIIGLYYIAKFFQIERNPFVYISVYTIGSGFLYFLTALTEEPPSATSLVAWICWIAAHMMFGILVAILIRKWIKSW